MEEIGEGSEVEGGVGGVLCVGDEAWKEMELGGRREVQGGGLESVN